MGPLSIAMSKVKEANGLALQAALSMARVRTLRGETQNTAIVTTGPSLHGKSTLTIMIELRNSELAVLLGLKEDPEEGVYPMNDDIVLIQPLREPFETTRGGHRLRISHGIDGTENNFYAVPAGLTKEEDPITYDVLRGTAEAPNSRETLENVVVDLETGKPDFLQNPTRNMRMILSREGLLARKAAQGLLARITNGRLSDAIHVPMEDTDRVLWQAVMRQNTVVPPLRRLRWEQYVRVADVRRGGTNGGGRGGYRQAVRRVLLGPVHHWAGGRERQHSGLHLAGSWSGGAAPGVLRLQHGGSGGGGPTRRQRGRTTRRYRAS